MKPGYLTYSLRAVRPLSLAGAAFAAVVSMMWLIPWTARQVPPASSMTAFVLLGTAMILGTCIGLAVGRDADEAETLARSLPTPFARTLMIRAISWLAVAATVVVVAAMSAADTLKTDAGHAIVVALAPLLITAAVAAVTARVSGSVAGGSVGMVAGAGHLFASWVRPDWTLALPLDPTLPEFAVRGESVAAAGASMMLAALVLICLSANPRSKPSLRRYPAPATDASLG